MKNKHILLFATALLLLLFTEYSHSQSLTTTNGYINFRNQILWGNNNAAFTFKSNNSDVTRLVFTDKENDVYGQIYGGSNGTHFGFLDGNSKWSYLAVKDNYTAFRIKDSEKMRIRVDGNVGIGTSTPNYKLDVCGIGRFKEILVEETWCDYVFESNYKLTTLEEEAEFIKLYGHLSNFESAKAMDGMINVNDVFKRQQVQIEENVLHLIELNLENETLQTQVNVLSETNKNLEERLAALEAKVH